MDEIMLYYSTNPTLPTTCKAYAAMLKKAKRIFNANLQQAIDWHTGDLNSPDTQAYIQNNPIMAACWMAECEKKGRVDAAHIVLHQLFDDADSVLSNSDKRKICINVTGLDPECETDWMW